MATTADVTAKAAVDRAAGTRDADRPEPVIIDLGRQKSKRVKDLRKGRGRLVDDITETMRELAAQGVVKDGAQPVIVLVREKEKVSLF
jgi:hypothetical protein